MVVLTFFLEGLVDESEDGDDGAPGRVVLPDQSDLEPVVEVFQALLHPWVGHKQVVAAGDVLHDVTDGGAGACDKMVPLQVKMST